MIPIHPEIVPDDGRALRWVMPGGTLPFIGEPRRVPDQLQCLFDAKVIAKLTVSSSSVLIQLVDGELWSEVGGRIRSVLTAALEVPEQWLAPTDALEPLEAAIDEVISGEIGDFIRSHHGSLRIVSVAGHRAAIELTGTCSACPARGVTLHERIEKAVRMRHPELLELTLVEPPKKKPFFARVPTRR